MRKFYFWALMAILGVCLTGCEKGQTEFFLSDLQGLWLHDGTQEFRRFTEESAADIRPGYFWGCEWDEGDPRGAVYESDLEYHGNGWFMYKLEGDELLEIEQTDYGWAEIPKVYTMVTLTASQMTYHPKDYKKEKVSFTKQ